MVSAILSLLGIILAGLLSVLLVGVSLVISFLPQIIGVLVIVLLIKMIRTRRAG